jgi:hypothetical protein
MRLDLDNIKPPGNDIEPDFNMPSIPKTSWLRLPRPRVGFP